MNFGEKLKAIRLSLNLTQDELAAKLGTTKQAISRYENSEREPNLRTAKEFSEKLGIALAILADDAISDLESVGLSVNDVAQEMGIPTKRITEILSDNSIHSAEAAAKIARVASLLAKEAAPTPQEQSERIPNYDKLSDTNRAIVDSMIAQLLAAQLDN